MSEVTQGMVADVDVILATYRLQDEVLAKDAWRQTAEERLEVQRAERAASEAMQRLSHAVGPHEARDLISRRMRGEL